MSIVPWLIDRRAKWVQNYMNNLCRPECRIFLFRAFRPYRLWANSSTSGRARHFLTFLATLFRAFPLPRHPRVLPLRATIASTCVYMHVHTYVRTYGERQNRFRDAKNSRPGLSTLVRSICTIFLPIVRVVSVLSIGRDHRQIKIRPRDFGKSFRLNTLRFFLCNLKGAGLEVIGSEDHFGEYPRMSLTTTVVSITNRRSITFSTMVIHDFLSTIHLGIKINIKETCV